MREFRANIGTLKKLGLVDTLKPSIALPNRRLNAAIKKYKDVLTGTATSLKKTQTGLTNAEAKRRGFRVVQAPGGKSRVVVGHFRDEKVRATKGAIEYVSPEGIRRLELPPARTDTLRHFFSDLRRKAGTKALPDKRKGESFAARFFNNRTQIYSSVKELLNTINTYETVVRAHGRKQTAEVIRNIEIFSMPRSDEAVWFAQKREEKIRREKEREEKRKAERKAAAKKKEREERKRK